MNIVHQSFANTLSGIVSLLFKYILLHWVHSRKLFQKLCRNSRGAVSQGEEKWDSSVVAKIVNLLATSSYGYRTSDCSRHTKTISWNDHKMHGAIMKNLRKQKRDSRSLLLLDFLFKSNQKYGCWRSITNFSKELATLEGLKRWSWF